MKMITLKRPDQMDLQFEGEKIVSVDVPDFDEDADFDEESVLEPGDPGWEPYPLTYNYTLYKTADSVTSCNYILYIIDTTYAFAIGVDGGKVETYQTLEELRKNFLNRDNFEKKRGQSFTKWQEKILTAAGINTVEILA